MQQEPHAYSDGRISEEQLQDSNYRNRNQLQQRNYSSQGSNGLRLSTSGMKLMNSRKNLRRGLQIRLIIKQQNQSESQRRQAQNLCEICQLLYSQQKMALISNCGHFYCFDCLYQYVVYKLTIFEQVLCPNQECTHSLSKQSEIYKKLNNQLKRKLSKNKKFFGFISNKKNKPCPLQVCDGILQSGPKQGSLKCQKCTRQFCQQCLSAIHKGACDEKIARKLQNNLGYRQCSNCKMIVQKNKGCQHITCKCGFQFCYICGNQYKTGHTCPLPLIPQDLNLLQRTDWLLSHRHDLIQFFHFYPGPYIHCTGIIFMGTNIDMTPNIRPLQTILFMLLIYPLSIAVAIIHIFYIFIFIHLFFILVFIIFFPCWIQAVYDEQHLDQYFKQKRTHLCIIVALFIIFFPIALPAFVVYCFGYFWLCNCGPNGGLIAVTKRQLRGNLAIWLNPCLAYSRRIN